MMKPNILTTLADVMEILLLRIKLIRKDIIMMGLLLLSIALFAFMLRSLTVSSEELSSLPIGIVDKDHSNSSKELILGLQKVETLRIIEADEKELNKQLLDEMITSYFIIEKGYEDNLKAGNLKDILTMNYKEDNKSVSIISDIVAGEMIYPISLFKSFHYYEKLVPEEQRLSLEQYQAYMQELVETSTDFDFGFQINYNNPLKDIKESETITNGVIYRQFIFGILGLIMAFLAMFILSQTIKEKENGLETRLNISRMNVLIRDTGNICALLICEGGLSLVFTVLIGIHLKIKDPGLWLSAYTLLLLNAIISGTVMLLISKLIRRMVTYQIVCTLLIIVTSGLGFYQLLTGFYQGFVDKLVNFIPNSWFIKGFTDIIIYGNHQGYWKEGHKVLLWIVVILLCLIIAIDLVQGRAFMKKWNKKDRMVN